jgi:hypothetical protein
LKTIKKPFNLKKIDISEFDILVYIINDADDFFVFTKIKNDLPINLKILMGATCPEISKSMSRFNQIIPLDLELNKKDLFNKRIKTSISIIKCKIANKQLK